jgi:ribonuclease BN (tRNA processing enzyme)
MLRELLAGILIVALGLVPVCGFSQTQVVVLGTGTPVPDPERAGASLAVIVDGEAYVFDAGDGMVRRATEASARYELPGLEPQSIRFLFLTHLHSDHIHDVSTLATGRWWAREERLTVFGPAGLGEYVGFMNEMSAVEAEIRARGTPAELISDRHGYLANANEIEDGIVFENESISVEAFTVNHGEIRPAFGYRVVTDDRTIVISGDTAYSETLVEKAAGADLLFHEAISGDRLVGLSEFWQRYHGASHTTTADVARIATQARPAVLVLYHVLFSGATEADVLAEVRRAYDGPVFLANDLDLF